MNDKKKATSTPGFNHEQLLAALRHVDDLLGARLGITTYVALKATARSIRDDKMLEGGGVSVGLRKNELTKERISLMKTLLEKNNVKFETNYIKYDFNNIPIDIKIIHRDYRFIKNYDSKPYWYDQYNVPNNFERYWKARGIIY